MSQMPDTPTQSHNPLLPNVAQGNRKTASDWNTVWNIGFHAGYDKAELAHNLEVIRLKGRIQLWRDVAFVSIGFDVAAIILLVNSIIK